MTDDEADKYYDQWLTARAQLRKAKEDIAFLVRELDKLEHLQDMAKRNEIAKRYGIAK